VLYFSMISNAGSMAMILVHELYTVPLGRHSEARQTWAEMQRQARGEDGFVWAAVCKYLGNIRTHMVLSQWASLEALAAWERLREPPYSRGAFIARQAPRLWELVVDSPGTAEGNFLLKGVLQAAEGRWDEFAKRRPHHDAAGISVGGIVFYRTYRYIGDPLENVNDHTALVLGCRTSRDVYEEWVESVAAKELAASDPPRLYTPMTADLFEVVSEEVAH
jgi:heme-degrading monooxygenase HmoA